MRIPNIFNIQKFSIHDGDGIRTTIFFKGCPLSCKWCHNPESQNFYKEIIVYNDRCCGCGVCIAKCPTNANKIINGKSHIDRTKCIACGTCTDWCCSNAREIAGKEYTIKELVKEVEKDRMFYEESKGGITLSGGEVMAQDIDYIEILCKILYEKGYSVNIDTCGFTTFSSFERILPYVDTFLYDIKLIDNDMHKKYTGVENTLILENLKKLSQQKARIYIRIPVIGNINDNENFINNTIRFLNDNRINILQVNLLPYHTAGSHKYMELDRDYDKDNLMIKPNPDDLDKFRKMFIQNGYINTKIGG